MTHPPLDPRLIQFVSRHFSSVRQLELLLWIYAHPEKAWNAEQTARALRCRAEMTANWLLIFFRNGWLTLTSSEAGLYRFRTEDPALGALVASLVDIYRVRPSRIIEIIGGAPTQKMMDLMNAFKICTGEGEEDDG